jgi:hypothetical protein
MPAIVPGIEARGGRGMGGSRSLGTGRRAVDSLSAIVALLWLAFASLDVAAYLGGGVSKATFWLKMAASLLCAATAWVAFAADRAESGGLVRALGFSMAFLGDVAVLLNTYEVMRAPIVFAVGGYLFIPALLLISLRNARFFSFLKVEGRFEPRKLLFPLCFYLPFAALLAVLGKALAGVGLLGLGIAYGTCLTTVLWTGWEAMRSRLYPPRRARMIAAGATLVFVMELVGTIYNLKLPGLSEIAFFATWILYVPGMLLMARA